MCEEFKKKSYVLDSEKDTKFILSYYLYTTRVYRL